MEKTIKVINNPRLKIYNWTNSQITLAWINKDPSDWKTFVSNKVATIRYTLAQAKRNYVNTKDNPADLMSSGYEIEKLPTHTLWWNGPTWLLDWNENDPLPIKDFETHIESKTKKNALLTNNSFIIDKLLQNYSDINKLLRAIAWLLRFLKVLKKGICKRSINRHIALPFDESNSPSRNPQVSKKEKKQKRNQQQKFVKKNQNKTNPVRRSPNVQAPQAGFSVKQFLNLPGVYFEPQTSVYFINSWWETDIAYSQKSYQNE